MKLSARLLGLDKLTGEQYDHIWDTCCDHGFLGAHLLSTKRSKAIHFVDCNAVIMEELQKKLRKFFPPNSPESSWYTHTVDAEKCPITSYPGKHLVIVAGVGGELATAIVQQLHQTYPEHEIDFLVCSTNHTFLVRQELQRCKLELVRERLVEDNKYFYELILLRQSTADVKLDQKLSVAGNELWKGDPHIATAYLKQLKKHYTRLLNSNRDFAQLALDAYEQIELETET